MKRPVPVVLSAIFLGMLAALQLLFAGLLVVAGILFLSKKPSVPTMPYPPSFIVVMGLLLSVICAASAVWSIVTLIGLVRLRCWARTSTMVIAGLMTFFAGVASLMSFAMPYLLSSVQSQTAVPNPASVHRTFLITGAVYGLFALIGIALLVYYNLAKTRTLFLQSAPVNLEPPHTSTGRPRPTAITVIGWLYLATAPFCLIYLFLPTPGYLFGFIFYGIAGRLLYSGFGVLNFMLGYGLLRLWNWARLTIFAMFGIGLVNALVLFTPWGRSQYHVYMNAFNAHMYAGQPPPPNLAASPVFIGIITLIAVACCGLILWPLYQHREAFTPAPPMPPMPLPLAG